MRIVLIADTFPPFRSSGAVQLRDLVREFIRQGHALHVFLPSADQHEPWKLESVDDAQVLRLKAPRTKDVGYVRRTIAELLMPFYMWWNLRKSPLHDAQWDAVVWYSPSIFFGPLVSWCRQSRSCKSYMIIRDIFPEWAVDMGLMRKGLVYRFYDAIARYQYSVADVIGVQTSGNRAYFLEWEKRPNRRLEVLQNWLDKPADSQCSVRLEETRLKGRKVFVYAGNMGVAQGLDIFLDMIERMRERSEIGFLFVGRGSEAERLKEEAQRRKLDSVIFFDEIDPDEIPSLYAQCDAGIVSLDSRHKSHNIPGKFLTYMQSGLPVLANINSGNDLAQLIRDERVGQVCDNNKIEELLLAAQELLVQIDSDSDLPSRCCSLFDKQFSVEKTVNQIVSSLSTAG